MPSSDKNHSTQSDKAARADRFESRSRVLINVARALLELGLVITVIVIATRQQSNTDTTQQKLDNGAKILQLISSCTTPGQACYQRGQANQAKIISIVDTHLDSTILASVVCANRAPNASLPELRACVIKELR